MLNRKVSTCELALTVFARRHWNIFRNSSVVRLRKMVDFVVGGKLCKISITKKIICTTIELKAIVLGNYVHWQRFFKILTPWHRVFFSNNLFFALFKMEIGYSYNWEKFFHANIFLIPFSEKPKNLQNSKKSVGKSVKIFNKKKI